MKKLVIQMEKQKLLYEERALVALQKITQEKSEALSKAETMQVKYLFFSYTQPQCTYLTLGRDTSMSLTYLGFLATGFAVDISRSQVQYINLKDILYFCQQEALITAKAEARRWQSLYEELKLSSAQLKENQHLSNEQLQQLHSQVEVRQSVTMWMVRHFLM